MPLSLSEQLIEICLKPAAPDTRRRGARHVLDWLGCALVGSTAPAGQALASYAENHAAATGNCFTAGASPRGPSDAAFINGGLGNIFEMDDLHRASILHVGDVVVPAALAVAQARQASGDELLEAVVAGYEIAIRIGSAAAASGYSSWYNSGTCGVFGASLAAGLLMKLEQDALADALGQAGMLASGIWQCRLEPTFSKQLATAHAAQSGVTAARLAATGFPGARQILEGELGFFKTYYPAADPSAVAEDASNGWKIDEVSFKPWSACRHAHPAIEAALHLRGACPPDDIRNLTLHTYAAAIDFCDNPTPTSDHEARFSLQHCVSTTLLYGEPQLDDFSERSRNDPSIKGLVNKISLANDEGLSARFPAMMGCRIEVEMGDSSFQNQSIATAKGDPENPMSDAELDAKFGKLAAAARIGDDAAAELAAAVLGLPGSSTLHRLDQSLTQISTMIQRTEP